MLLTKLAFFALTAFAAVAPLDSCPSVQSLGSPAGLIHQHIETLYKSLSVTSTGDQFRLIFFSENDSDRELNYQLIFWLRQANSQTDAFIGLVAVSADPAASSIDVPYAIAKFIQSDSISEVKMVIGVQAEPLLNGYPCPDLKERFTKFLVERNLYSFSGVYRKNLDSANEARQNNSLATQGQQIAVANISSAGQNGWVTANSVHIPSESLKSAVAANNFVQKDELAQSSKAIDSHTENSQQTAKQVAQKTASIVTQGQKRLSLTSVDLDQSTDNFVPISINVTSAASSGRQNQALVDNSAKNVAIVQTSSNNLTKAASPELKSLADKDSSKIDLLFPKLNYQYATSDNWYEKFFATLNKDFNAATTQKTTASPAPTSYQSAAQTSPSSVVPQAQGTATQTVSAATALPIPAPKTSSVPVLTTPTSLLLVNSMLSTSTSNDPGNSILTALNSQQGQLTSASEASVKKGTTSQITQVQNTQLASNKITNNNFGAQTIFLNSQYPKYEQIDIHGSSGAGSNSNRLVLKDIDDENQKQTGQQMNPGIAELLNKGMTYEQILQIVRREKNSELAQSAVETSKRNAADNQRLQLLLQKLKDEQDMLQKLNLLLAYRKRQEDGNATTKVRPTEYLYSNLYGAGNKIPATLGQQSFYTVVPDSFVQSNPELSPYLSLCAADLSRIISQKEKYIASLNDMKTKEFPNSSGKEGTNADAHDQSVLYGTGNFSSVPYSQTQFLSGNSDEWLAKINGFENKSDQIVSAYTLGNPRLRR